MKNKQQPLVTIVTITFNLIKNGREKYFRQCLESVHSQTYKKIEHIIIDGASKDGTLDLIQEYSEKGWVKCFSEPDKGVYDAMNKGIKQAKGKYVCFLNSDDYFHNKDAVKISAETLEESRADYSFADNYSIDHQNDRIIDVWHGNINLIPFGTHYCHQTMFTKTSVLEELGGFDLSYKVSADSDLMIQLFSRNKKHVYVPECIVSYRGGGLSNQQILQTRKDHSRAFYKNVGRELGLNMAECYSLWNFSLLRENSVFYVFKLSKKLKEEWKKELLKKLYSTRGLRGQISYVLPEIITKPLSDLSYLAKQSIKGFIFWMSSFFKRKD